MVYLFSLALFAGERALFAYVLTPWLSDVDLVSILDALVRMLIFIPVFLMVYVGRFSQPAMYLRRVPILEALKITWDDLVRPHFYSVVGYLLFMFLIWMAISFLHTVVVVMTCWIGALPVVSQFVLLPLLMFPFITLLEFLGQIGPNWQFFSQDDNSVNARKRLSQNPS